MPITIYLNETTQVERMINWGLRSAITEQHDLLLIVPRRQKGSVKWDPLLKSEAGESEIFQRVFDVIAGLDPERVVLKEDVTDKSESDDKQRIVIETRELVSPNPAKSFVDLVAELDIVRLIVPAVSQLNTQDKDASWAQRLYQDAPCETMMVWGSPPPLGEPTRVLVVADSDTESSLAARRAAQLSQSDAAGTARLLYVWPDDDEVAPQIAAKKTKSILSGSGASKSDFDTSVYHGNSLVEGIDAEDCEHVDMVLFGTANVKKIRAVVRVVSGKEPQPALAVIRPAVSISKKMTRGIQAAIRRFVPQLERDERISLVEQLETNSKFNFDFCALISLSTLIAALGLADDSAAVVIGAMLVAPLMTPLVGIGFALIQGNLDLIRNARWAVLYGFAVAFAIGVLVGAIIGFSGGEITKQMSDRDSPSMLDLLVALASGIAGAYAISRKNLNSAIPGVAIAAALVPPIATSGMAAAMGDSVLALGALFLFLTNIVFIVLGTAIVFWSIGIDTRKQKNGDAGKQKPYLWVRYWFVAFVVASLILAWVISHPFAAAPNPESSSSNVSTDQK